MRTQFKIPRISEEVDITSNLSCGPWTLVLISPGYLEIRVTGRDQGGEVADVLVEHLVTANVRVLVGVQGRHVQLGEPEYHPLYGFSTTKTNLIY